MLVLCLGQSCRNGATRSLTLTLFHSHSKGRKVIWRAMTPSSRSFSLIQHMFQSPVATLEFSRAAMCNLLLRTQTIYKAVHSPRYARLNGVTPKSIVPHVFYFLTRTWFHKVTGWVLSFSEASCPAQRLTVSERWTMVGGSIGEQPILVPLLLCLCHR